MNKAEVVVFADLEAQLETARTALIDTQQNRAEAFVRLSQTTQELGRAEAQRDAARAELTALRQSMAVLAASWVRRSTCDEQGKDMDACAAELAAATAMVDSGSGAGLLVEMTELRRNVEQLVQDIRAVNAKDVEEDSANAAEVLRLQPFVTAFGERCGCRAAVRAGGLEEGLCINCDNQALADELGKQLHALEKARQLAAHLREDRADAQREELERMYIIAKGLWLRRGFENDHPIIVELGERLHRFEETNKAWLVPGKTS